MTYVFNPDRYSVTMFYSYPCCVVDREVEYEEGGLRDCHRISGDVSVKEFFEAVLKIAEEITGHHLMDNKIAFKVIDKVENKTFYVGYKDNIYCIGKELNPYMNSCYVYDLETYTKSIFPCRVC